MITCEPRSSRRPWADPGVQETGLPKRSQFPGKCGVAGWAKLVEQQVVWGTGWGVWRFPERSQFRGGAPTRIGVAGWEPGPRGWCVLRNEANFEAWGGVAEPARGLEHGYFGGRDGVFGGFPNEANFRQLAGVGVNSRGFRRLASTGGNIGISLLEMDIGRVVSRFQRSRQN